MHGFIKQYFSRPFSIAHWWATLLPAWVIVTFGRTCERPPYYVEAVLATATICIALWVNHIKIGAGSTLRDWLKVFGGGVADIVRLSLWTILVGLPILIMTHPHCYTSRAKMSELLLHAHQYKAIIAENILKSGSTLNAGAGIRFELSERAKFVFITSDGSIFAMAEDPVGAILLTPYLANGAVTWKCRGYPQKYVPAYCRDELLEKKDDKQ